ncbi:PH domain-containing protein [Microbacterium sp. ET2]|uniref:PH domain-containing protein n=1 Tax=Microbacterium albipurpureum TaxID=3050384 RepID=UPI00259C823C|nr:PH domain-containing protein [Microbacterium sp. ET2 (Ac-2212)]WJL97087.1 PH domain-containing protein [Microbacterium sp. ET2 (Ac-2212)]
MTSAPAPTRSPLSDGDWHRLHPFTPLLRGGLTLVIIAGILIANFRDRLIQGVVPIFVPEVDPGDFETGDPLDFIFERGLILAALGAVIVVVVVLVGVFYLSWRFHTFRITGDDVEVRSGVLFRTQRRAPLDRVQGVNLTRPMIARLMGMAKLEVVGAGTDGNVKLEYLSTANAEAVRADILRLASGRRLAEARQAAAAAGGGRVSAAASTVAAGLTEMIEGAEDPADEPDSVVNIPVGRLIASHLLDGSLLFLIVLVAAIVVASILGTPWLLLTAIPALLGFGAYWVRTITRSLRYSIAPTSSGVRITFGLFTTVTETLPPGRIHALEISQPILWRPAGWWAITVNRLSGRGLEAAGTDQFATVLPVGNRTDVERVLQLLLPHLPREEWPLVFRHGVLGPEDGDPYVTTPRRAAWLRPTSWRRNGAFVTPDVLFVRRGFIWRKLALFPLARMQSLAIAQGPVDRALGVANLQVHTVVGRVSGSLGIIDRDDAVSLFERTEAAAIVAAANDRSHRWAGDEAPDEVAVTVGAAAPPPEVPGPVASTDPGRTEEVSR